MQKRKTLGEILREPVRNAPKFLSYPQGALGIFPSRKLALSRIGDTRDEIRNPFRSCMNDLAPSAIPLEDGENSEKESTRRRENAREREMEPALGWVKAEIFTVPAFSYATSRLSSFLRDFKVKRPRGRGRRAGRPLYPERREWGPRELDSSRVFAHSISIPHDLQRANSRPRWNVGYLGIGLATAEDVILLSIASI